MTEIFDRLIGPRRAGLADTDLYRARLVAATTLMCTVTVSALVVLAIALRWGAGSLSVLGGCALVIGASLGYMRRTGRFERTAMVQCVAIVSAGVALSFMEGGLDHPGLDWLSVVVLYAPLVLGRRAAWGLVAAALVG